MSTTTETPMQIHEEDVELVQKLAKLQEMHQQISELRTLLPTKLLAPTRDALDKKITPSDLARALSTAVQTGRHDIRSFRKNWNEEKTRSVFQQASTTKGPQGVDAWNVDYVQFTKSTSTIATTSESSLPSETQRSDDIFNKSQDLHKNLTISFPREPNKLPIHVTSGGMQFSIEDQSSIFSIDVLEDTPNQKLANQVAREIRESKSTHDLPSLLDLFEAYHDIKSQPCHECNHIYNENLELPLVRRAASNTGNTDQKTVWQNFHKDCA